MNQQVYRTTSEPGQAPEKALNRPASKTISVPDAVRPCRIDAFLSAQLREEGYSREKIKNAILSGQVQHNGSPCVKPNTLVFPGDTITTTLPSPVVALTAEQGELSVLWRDDHLAVCEKPAGLTVHPAPGLAEGTFANRLLHHFPVLAAQGGLRPGIVHRLDKDTSGLLLVALTEASRLAMSEAFAKRTIHKEYLALVHGVPPKEKGAITVPIGRDAQNKTKMAVVSLAKGGKEAHSEYTVLHADPEKRFSLVRVAIHTGRTHQIRVHMHHLGNPLLGDMVYKNPQHSALHDLSANRQMLHAHTLAFTHPVTNETMFFRSTPPEDFTSLALSLAQPMQRVIVTGSPGGGKSTLTHAIRDAGNPTWSADDAVQRLYANGGDGWHMLKARYGTRFIADDTAEVDKKALFAAMKESDSFRRELEHMIHPLVFHDLELFWRQCEQKKSSLAAAEIPLALESGRFDQTTRTKNALQGERREILAGIYCPFATRKSRLMETRGWTEEIVARMESWQWPEERKVKHVDLVVDNSGDREALQRRSQNILGVLAFLREQTRLRLTARLNAFWNCGK